MRVNHFRFYHRKKLVIVLFIGKLNLRTKCDQSRARNGQCDRYREQKLNKSSSGDEIPERDVTYIVLYDYLFTTEL